jgi:hypothetical protein
MSLVVVTPPSTAGAATSQAFTVELGWFYGSHSQASNCESSTSACVEVLSALSTSISTPRPKSGEPVPFSATATMPFDSQSEILLSFTAKNTALSIVCAWFYPAAAKAASNPVFFDEFGDVTFTSYLFQYESYLFQYEQGTGTSVQVTFTADQYQLFAVPPAGSTTTTTSNLIADGDFSQPVVNGFETFYPLAKTTLASAVNSINGWTVGSNSVDVMGHAYWKPLPPGSPGDSQSVDLSGGAPGSISQTVSTTAGSSYLLKWYASGNYGCGQSTKVMHVFWDRKLIASPSVNTGGPAAGKMVWSAESQVVAANAAQSVLEFADATPDKSPCGAVVADVSLTADTNA